LLNREEESEEERPEGKPPPPPPPPGIKNYEHKQSKQATLPAAAA